ncbi:MAG: transglycosylase SLT domain-containing protein [Gammaproteobacteria bacterium]|nr:transglycosylase SLT domain-containing protein [Gammaproteobacteria bacterium]
MLLFALLALQVACGDASTSSRAGQGMITGVDSRQAAGYVETGDLDAIRDRGTLRVLMTASGDGACHSRAAGPLERELLDAIGAEQRLEIAWICVYPPDTLATALLEGRGDLVLSDLSGPPWNADVAVTLPRVVARHWVVTDSGDGTVHAVADLAGKRVAAARDGSAWARLVEWRRRVPSLVPVPLSAPLEPDAVRSGLVRGQFDAALVSSDDWDGRDATRIAFDAGNAAPVRWSVRPGATALLAAIDRKFTTTRLVDATAPLRRGDLGEIRRHRVLRVLARPRPGSFYLRDGELRGFEHDLLARFADRHGVEIEVVVPPADERLVDWLAEGRGDVIGLPLEPADVADTVGLRTTRAYRVIATEIVGPAGAAPLDGPGQLAGRTVYAVHGSKAWSRLTALRAKGIDITAVAMPRGTPTVELLARLDDGDGALVAVSEPRPASRDRTALLELDEPSPRVWATRDTNPKLHAALDRFIRDSYRGVDYNVLARRYSRAQAADDPAPAAETLSPYDELVRELAEEYGFDWRLIVAQMFQESRFDPEARSEVGARGLMQVMPATGRELGFTDLEHPAKSIRAGVMYLAQLRDRFGRDVPVTERLRFALAAYNAGFARVSAARRLAVEMGLDPDRWFGHVERALHHLPRADSEIARGHRGCRCGQPVHYVRRIQARFAAYTRLGSGLASSDRIALLEGGREAAADASLL